MEEGAELVPVRVLAELVDDQHIGKGGGVDQVSVAFSFGIGIVVAEHGSFEAGYVILDVGFLLGLKVLHIRVVVLVGHGVTGLRLKFGFKAFKVPQPIDLEDVASRHVISGDLSRLKFGNIQAVAVALDAFAQQVESPVIAVDHQFYKLPIGSVMSHLLKQAKRKRKADLGLVDVHGVQDPIFLGAHAKEIDVGIHQVAIPGFHRVGALVKSLRGVASPLNADVAKVVGERHADLVQLAFAVVDDAH